MTNSSLRSDASLPEVLAERARHASDHRLVADVAGGLVVVVVTLLWRPPAWPLVLAAALCFSAFGAWGIADRELGEGAHAAVHLQPAVLRGVRVAAAVVGTLAALALLVGVLGLALGTWIS